MHLAAGVVTGRNPKHRTFIAHDSYPAVMVGQHRRKHLHGHIVNHQPWRFQHGQTINVPLLPLNLVGQIRLLSRMLGLDGLGLELLKPALLHRHRMASHRNIRLHRFGLFSLPLVDRR